MATGLPVIVNVTDLDPAFYGDDPHPPSDNDKLGPDRDARMICDMFDGQRERAPGLLAPMLLGMGPSATGAPPTRENLVATLRSAAQSLRSPKDTLFLYYSGHGVRLKPDVAGPDMRDALCLMDGFFLDVELVALWHEFDAQARVVMFSDCCHAGDMATTSLWQRLLGVVRKLVGKDPRGAVRSLFDDRADDIATKHAATLVQQFNDAAARGGTDVAGIPCALLNFAASSPDELLPTDDGESPFALALVTGFGLNRKRCKSYIELASIVFPIIEPRHVTPLLEAAGRDDHDFETSTPPFTV